MRFFSPSFFLRGVLECFIHIYLFVDAVAKERSLWKWGHGMRCGELDAGDTRTRLDGVCFSE